jgi:hypothetical protein
MGNDKPCQSPPKVSKHQGLAHLVEMHPNTALPVFVKVCVSSQAVSSRGEANLEAFLTVVRDLLVVLDSLQGKLEMIYQLLIRIPETDHGD